MKVKNVIMWVFFFILLFLGYIFVQESTGKVVRLSSHVVDYRVDEKDEFKAIGDELTNDKVRRYYVIAPEGDSLVQIRCTFNESLHFKKYSPVTYVAQYSHFNPKHINGRYTHDYINE